MPTLGGGVVLQRLLSVTQGTECWARGLRGIRARNLFLFGQSRDEAQSACTNHHLEFLATEKTEARCSGLVANLGFKAAAQLAFCGDSVCKIALVLDPDEVDGGLLKSYLSIETALTDKYGQPAARTSVIPGDCAEQEVRECLQAGRVNEPGAGPPST